MRREQILTHITQNSTWLCYIIILYNMQDLSRSKKFAAWRLRMQLKSRDFVRIKPINKL